jgi:hypothetical protein
MVTYQIIVLRTVIPNSYQSDIGILIASIYAKDPLVC